MAPKYITNPETGRSVKKYGTVYQELQEIYEPELLHQNKWAICKDSEANAQNCINTLLDKYRNLVFPSLNIIKYFPQTFVKIPGPIVAVYILNHEIVAVVTENGKIYKTFDLILRKRLLGIPIIKTTSVKANRILLETIETSRVASAKLTNEIKQQIRANFGKQCNYDIYFDHYSKMFFPTLKNLPKDTIKPIFQEYGKQDYAPANVAGIVTKKINENTSHVIGIVSEPQHNNPDNIQTIIKVEPPIEVKTEQLQSNLPLKIETKNLDYNNPFETPISSDILDFETPKMSSYNTTPIKDTPSSFPDSFPDSLIKPRQTPIKTQRQILPNILPGSYPESPIKIQRQILPDILPGSYPESPVKMQRRVLPDILPGSYPESPIKIQRQILPDILPGSYPESPVKMQRRVLPDILPGSYPESPVKIQRQLLPDILPGSYPESPVKIQRQILPDILPGSYPESPIKIQKQTEQIIKTEPQSSLIIDTQLKPSSFTTPITPINPFATPITEDNPFATPISSPIIPKIQIDQMPVIQTETLEAEHDLQQQLINAPELNSLAYDSLKVQLQQKQAILKNISCEIGEKYDDITKSCKKCVYYNSVWDTTLQKCINKIEPNFIDNLAKAIFSPNKNLKKLKDCPDGTYFDNQNETCIKCEQSDMIWDESIKKCKSLTGRDALIYQLKNQDSFVKLKNPPNAFISKSIEDPKPIIDTMIKKSDELKANDSELHDFSQIIVLDKNENILGVLQNGFTDSNKINSISSPNTIITRI